MTDYILLSLTDDEDQSSQPSLNGHETPGTPPEPDSKSICSTATYHSAVMNFLGSSSDSCAVPMEVAHSPVMVKEIAGIVSEQSHCHENQDRYHGNQDRCHGNPDRYHGNPDRYHGIPDRCQEDLEDPFFPSSDPLSESDPYSIEDPPSYEESVGEDWNTNLTWPNTLANRDELAQIFRLNNYDYSTRGRAFTVSGPAETHLPRYRNIINYFENSLDNVSSVEWSGGGSVQSSRIQLLGSGYPSTELESNILNRSGPKPHKIGARTSSHDVIHWEYINDEQPPNYSITEHASPGNYSKTEHVSPGNGLTECRPCPTDCRPCPTTGTCDIDSCNDTSRHCTINKEIDPSFGALGIRVSLQKQPSAPSLEQLEEPVSRRPSSVYELGRTYTAPARLEKEEPTPGPPPNVDLDENKTVSFFMGDREVSDSALVEHSKKEELETRTHPEMHFNAFEKNETITSETGDSGYDDESCLIRDITPPPKFSAVKRENYTVRIEADGSKARLVAEPAPVPTAEDWENHRLFRYQKPQRRLTWKFWVGLTFFLCDILLVVTGALLLITNYHDNMVPGFVLLGLGIGMCIPALNYLGGLSTVCARIEGASTADVFL